jgi:predicted amidohydrolase
MTMETPDLNASEHDTLKIGLCQIQTEPWAIEENLDRTLAAIEQAAANGAELALTPECVLEGYPDPIQNGEDYRRRIFSIAEPMDGERFARVAQTAKRLGVYVGLGFVEKSDENHIHNSVALISPEGEVLKVYRKVHCRSVESAEYDGAFTPGERFVTQSIEVGERRFTAGMMICFDREIPESVRSLRALGAEIVLCPLATNTADFSILSPRADNEMITRCRAAENELFIVVVNHAARYNGGSFVVGPSGEVLLQMGSAPEVQVIELPVGIIKDRFHSDPLGWMGWGYRRPTAYSAS